MSYVQQGPCGQNGPWQPRRLAIGLLFGMAMALAPALAFASGGGGGMGGSGSSGGSSGGSSAVSSPPTDMTTCPKGQVWNTKRHKCVRAQSGALPDDAMTDYAFALAKAHRYAEALDILNLLQNQNTPKALNYRGYATRKLGRTEEGIGYYLKSVAMAPRYAQVREYLGEAYVVQGKFDRAKEQLDTIKALCGTGCEEYEDLAKAISTGKV